MEYRNMDEILFTSNQAKRILGINQRRLTNLVERGLTIPEKDAAGAGNRRLYNYLNLLELVLSESLFQMAFGIHLVKKILDDLRTDGSIKLWAEDFDSHFDRIAKRYKDWFEEEYSSKQGSHPVIVDSKKKKILDPTFWQDQEAIKKSLKPDKPIGILFYCFKKNKLGKNIVIPWDLAFSLNAPFLKKEMLDSEGIIIIDLGEIKRKVDKNIKTIEL